MPHASPGKAKWSGAHQQNQEDNEFKLLSVTCYTNSRVSLIHINTTKLYEITCNTLVATCVIIWSLECIMGAYMGNGSLEYNGSRVHSNLYKCYPYKRYNFMYATKTQWVRLVSVMC